MLTNFQTYFTETTRRKVVMISLWSLKIPSSSPTPQLLLHYLLKLSVLKAISEIKATSVTTHFKKLTTENVFIVSVII